MKNVHDFVVLECLGIRTDDSRQRTSKFEDRTYSERIAERVIIPVVDDQSTASRAFVVVFRSEQICYFTGKSEGGWRCFNTSANW
jgi:hypothetical protein